MKNYRKQDFDYELPQALIAQHPAKPRDASRLMCLHKDSNTIEHKHFYDLPDVLRRGDLLVFNNSKVLPARLFGTRVETGGKCELLLLKPIQGTEWECLAKPARRLRVEDKLEFGGGALYGTVTHSGSDGKRNILFDGNQSDFLATLDEIGEMPLPPYIKSELKDKNDYQTVYAEKTGSSAAPTAGLHFTPALLQRLQDKGIETAFVTLHVGLGTFRPVQEEYINNHVMHREWYAIDDETADKVNAAKQSGNRVFAVGTTACRTIESAADSTGQLTAGSGETDIFIYPGKELRLTDGLITNFHLPESTLIMLVAAFYGHEKTMNAYRLAVENGYRFYSFGDAMIIE